MQIKRGDVLLINFEPVKGSEQGRIRPALVVQNDILNKFSPLTIVIPITSKIYSKEYPTNVLIPKNNSGLNVDSTALSNQIRAVDKRRVIKRIGLIDNFYLKKVEKALKISLSLD